MHTVDAIAAGTLKMTLMIWFKFRSMNTVASRFARKLDQMFQLGKSTGGGLLRDLRDHEIDQAVLEKHVHEL